MVLFPAHAGVIPDVAHAWIYASAFPRTRGGDPKIGEGLAVHSNFSPHTRG